MSEVLLQTIIEKLEALEIAWLKQGNAANETEKLNELAAAVQSVQSEVIKLSSESKTSNDCINNLSKEINALRLKFIDPKQNQVRHIHHFHKHIWISLALLIVSLLLAYGWMNCHNEKKQFEASDIKYRFWKANGNTSLLKIIFYTDSLYNLDKDDFTSKVIRAEHTIAEQEKMHRLAVEKKKINEQ